MITSPLGLHRVIEPPGVLPQAAWRLDASPAIAPDEVRLQVDRLNLDAASYRQLRESHAGHPDKIRQAGFAVWGGSAVNTARARFSQGLKSMYPSAYRASLARK